MNYTKTQFYNLIETMAHGFDLHPDELTFGEWTNESLYMLKDIDLIEDILNSLNNEMYKKEGYEEKYKVKLAPAFWAEDEYIDYIVSDCIDVEASRYVKLPIFKDKIARMFLDFVDPSIYCLGEKLFNNIGKFRYGKVKDIWFKTDCVVY